MSQDTPEEYVEDLLREAGLEVVKWGKGSPPYVQVIWGGSADGDESLTLGQFQVQIVDEVDKRFSVIAGQVWRAVWEDDYHSVLGLVSEGENDEVRLGTLVGNADYDWWLSDEFPWLADA